MAENDNLSDAEELVQLHKLADAGDAEGLYRLGMRYFRGEGVVQDAVIGSRLLYLASKQDHVEAERVLKSWWD